MKPDLQKKLSSTPVDHEHQRMTENVRILRSVGNNAAATATAQDYYKRTGLVI